MARVEGESHLKWFPKATVDDYGISIRASAGRVWGDVTIDELFSAGVDRDRALQLRGHQSTHQGQKGAGPIGRRYVLMNYEVAKDVLSKNFFKVRVVPFMDLSQMGATYIDAGAELRISLASLVTVSVTFGRDLKNGRNVFFLDTTN